MFKLNGEIFFINLYQVLIIKTYITMHSYFLYKPWLNLNDNGSYVIIIQVLRDLQYITYIVNTTAIRLLFVHY